jgi:hypothetical protein
MAVNLSPVGGVAAQFFDNAGNVLTGGKLFTYAAGTTTPQTAYTTSAGNVAWSNPIILDAAGRVSGSGEIWLTDGVQYKFILRDSNDVLIATYDNINGINSNFVAFTNQQEIQTATAGQTVFNLNTTQYSPGTNSLSVFVDGVNQYGPGAQYAYFETDSNTVTFVNGLHVGALVKFTTSQINSSGAGDASQISYTAPYLNSITTNVEFKLAQTVSVKDFGAVGDGVADDTTAIQNAVDAVISVGGGTLYFPSTDNFYKVTSSVVIDYSGSFYATNTHNKKIHIVGDGSASTNIIATSGNYALISLIGNSTNNTVYFKLEGLRLTSTSLTASSIGVSFNKAAFVVIDDIVIDTFNVGINAVDTEQIGIYNSQIRFNNFGIDGSTGVITSPNSWSFYNTAISNNFSGGAYIVNPNALNYNGGSIQYNGYIGGGAANYGFQVVEAGNGYGTIGFTNMIFEGNGGLGDFVNGQTTNPATISFDNVSFLRTVGFFSATVTGAANNGSGAIRLAVNSTAALVGQSKVAVWGVVGTTEANNATPWSFTIIDGTHIDLTGSTFTNAYVSGGYVSIVGFGTNNILMDGSNANTTVAITNCTFKYGANYLQSASRRTIALTNVNSKIWDDGSSYFQSSVEKLTYIQTQQIGDDGSAWAAYTPTVSASGGTFTATATGVVKKINKNVYFQIAITTTAYTATPTAPLNVSVPFAAAVSCVFSGLNFTNSLSCTGLLPVSSSTIAISRDGNFPIAANGQVLIISGVYQTSI